MRHGTRAVSTEDKPMDWPEQSSLCAASESSGESEWSEASLLHDTAPVVPADDTVHLRGDGAQLLPLPGDRHAGSGLHGRLPLADSLHDDAVVQYLVSTQATAAIGQWNV